MRTIYCLSGEHIQLDLNTLVGAKLDGVNLHRALLEKEDLRSASFVSGELRNAMLMKSDVSEADFSNNLMVMADLRGVLAYKAKFINCNLSASKLDFGDFTNANFYGANVRDVSFDGAKLFGADMRCKNLDKALLYGIDYDENTLWPTDFEIEAFYSTDFYPANNAL